MVVEMNMKVAVKQLDDMYTITRKAITNTDALRNKKDNNIARKKQQQLINKAPKKAHKKIFKDKHAQPRASLQAVKDLETGKIETQPTKQAQIFEKYFKDSWQAINIKYGTYLPEEAPRNYPWEHTENEQGTKPPDPFKLQTMITQDESNSTKDGNWLHSSILDKSAFTNVINP